MIYFIKAASGHVKIGYTENDVTARLNSLQTGNQFKLSLLKVIEGDTRQERLLHNKFRDYRCEGEWFLLAGAILEFIESPYVLRAKGKPIPAINQKPFNFMKNSRQTNWQYKQTNQGLCSSCGKRPLAGTSKWYCRICLEKKRSKARIRRLRKLF